MLESDTPATSSVRPEITGLSNHTGSHNPALDFLSNLRSVAEVAAISGRASVENLLREVVSSHSHTCTRIHDNFSNGVQNVEKWWTNQSQKVVGTAAAGFSMVTGLLGFGVAPASAQSRIDISNVEGAVGANFGSAAPMATGAVTRLDNFGGGISGTLAVRGIFNIDNGQSYTLLANKAYDFTFTGYFAGLLPVTGAQVELNAQNLGVHLSLTTKDVNGTVRSSNDLEFSSALTTVRKLNNFSLTAANGVTGTNGQQYHRYELGFTGKTFQNNVDFTGLGTTFDFGTGNSGFRVYAANTFGAEGQYLQRQFIGGPLLQSEFENGVPLGFSILTQGSPTPNPTAPEPGSAVLVLLAGGGAILFVAGEKFLGTVKINSSERTSDA